MTRIVAKIKSPEYISFRKTAYKAGRGSKSPEKWTEVEKRGL